MKRILPLFAIICPVLLFAQGRKPDSTVSATPPKDTVKTVPVANHLRFKNVEINGSESEFIKKLQQQGFVADNEGLKGLFAGYDVNLRTEASPLSHTIYGVRIYFNAKTDFSAAKDDYIVFRDNLASVYGKPDNVTEKFIQPYVQGDGYSMKALHEGKATFISVWYTDLGKITCIIVAIGNNKASLMLKYNDAINADKNSKEKIIVIQRDL